MSRPLLTLLALAVLNPGPAAAHDWPSPAAGASQQTQAPRWPGLRWAGPQDGRPPAPSARDCRGDGARFSVPAGMAEVQSRNERLRDADGRRAERRSAEAPVAAYAMPPPAAEFKPAPPAAPAPSPITSLAPRPAPQPLPVDSRIAAGVVDDNIDFGAFTQFHARHGSLLRPGLSIRDRVRLDVRDSEGRPVPDAVVSVRAGGRPLPLWARTDAGGQAWLTPQADARGHGEPWEVEVAGQRVLWTVGQKDALQVQLPAAAAPRARLDLAFVIDATGSMGDEIDKLKASMRAVAAQIDKLPSRPDLCWSLLAYRDRGDEFFVRGIDFTERLDRLQTELNALQAGGGGDMPEAANEALHTAIHSLSWRGDGTARLVIHLADAPPQQSYGAPHLPDNARAALARGIKIMSIGASGLDREGEVAMRQMAQHTGGRFVFLTYANAHNPSAGPGRETTHEVENYSVESLDKLVVRLVREEMGRWPSDS